MVFLGSPAIRDVICNERFVESFKRFLLEFSVQRNLLACLPHMHMDGERSTRTDKWCGVAWHLVSNKRIMALDLGSAGDYIPCFISFVTNERGGDS